MTPDDQQFWLNAHYIEKWEGVEARNEYLRRHGVTDHIEAKQSHSSGLDWYVRNDIKIILEPRVPIGQVWLVQLDSLHEETRLPEVAGDRGCGYAHDSNDPVGDGEG